MKFYKISKNGSNPDFFFKFIFWVDVILFKMLEWERTQLKKNHSLASLFNQLLGLTHLSELSQLLDSFSSSPKLMILNKHHRQKNYIFVSKSLQKEITGKSVAEMLCWSNCLIVVQLETSSGNKKNHKLFFKI